MEVNTVLDFGTITCEQFNKIPHINSQRNKCTPEILGSLSNLFRKHGVEETYAPHLLHRHFGPNAHIMFNYQLENEPRVHVTRALPLPSFDEIQLRPHLYLNDVGKWQAYVYERGGIGSVGT
jgi:hypothetical protein